MLPAALGVVGVAAVAPTEPAGMNCGMQLKVLRRTGAGLRSVAVGGGGAGTAVPAGSLVQLLLKVAAAAGPAAVSLNVPALPCGDTSGDWGSSGCSCCCCCQVVCGLACEASVGARFVQQLTGLAVLQAALACASAASSCRT
jgi:hypothetical protein